MSMTVQQGKQAITSALAASGNRTAAATITPKIKTEATIPVSM
jgi:hypothetical protein